MESFAAYLEQSEALLAKKARLLKQEGRKDEADLAQIERNIYGICRTVYLALSARMEPQAFSKAYLDKLEEFSVNWKNAEAMAAAHSDGQRAAIEAVKLAALQDIRSRYREQG